MNLRTSLFSVGRLLVLPVAFVAFLALFPTAVHADALTALWDFNGTWATTSANHSYDLTPGGGATLVPSPWGMAAEFHGGSYLVGDPAMDRADTAATPTNASFNGGLSVMAWVKVHDLTNQINSPILSHDNSSGPNLYPYNNLGFTVSVGSDFDLALRDNSDNRVGVTGTGNNLITVNQWYHIAVTWGGSNSNSFALYINGVSVPYSFVMHAPSFLGLNGSNPYPIRIGASHGDSSQHAYAFSGAIDHISLYSGALTAAEVQADYQASVPEPSTLNILGSGLIGLLLRGWRQKRRMVT